MAAGTFDRLDAATLRGHVAPNPAEEYRTDADALALAGLVAERDRIEAALLAAARAEETGQTELKLDGPAAPSPAELKEDWRACCDRIEAVEAQICRRYCAARTGAGITRDARAWLDALTLEAVGALAEAAGQRLEDWTAAAEFLRGLLSPQYRAARFKGAPRLATLDALAARRAAALFPPPRGCGGLVAMKTGRAVRAWQFGFKRGGGRLNDWGALEVATDIHATATGRGREILTFKRTERFKPARVSVGADKLLRACLTRWTATGAKDTAPTFAFTLDALAAAYGVAEDRTARDWLRKQAEAAAEELRAARLSILDTRRGRDGAPVERQTGAVAYLDAWKWDAARGALVVRLGATLTDALKTERRITWFPLALLALNERNRAAYALGLKIAEVSSLDAARIAGRAGRLSVRACLAAAGIVAPDELGAESRHWFARSFAPLAAALDTLRGGVLADWYFADGDGLPLFSAEAGTLDAEAWQRCAVCWTLAPTFPAEELARIAARAEAAEETRQAAAEAPTAPTGRKRKRRPAEASGGPQTAPDRPNGPDRPRRPRGRPKRAAEALPALLPPVAPVEAAERPAEAPTGARPKCDVAAVMRRAQKARHAETARARLLELERMLPNLSGAEAAACSLAVEIARRNVARLEAEDWGE